MPQKNSLMRNPDRFVMDEDTVNVAVAEYLVSRGFQCKTRLLEDSAV